MSEEDTVARLKEIIIWLGELRAEALFPKMGQGGQFVMASMLAEAMRDLQCIVNNLEANHDSQGNPFYE